MHKSLKKYLPPLITCGFSIIGGFAYASSCKVIKLIASTPNLVCRNSFISSHLSCGIHLAVNDTVQVQANGHNLTKITSENTFTTAKILPNTCKFTVQQGAGLIHSNSININKLIKIINQLKARPSIAPSESAIKLGNITYQLILKSLNKLALKENKKLINEYVYIKDSQLSEDQREVLQNHASLIREVIKQLNKVGI